ncbi:MAG TPA: cysteine--tRNA ligase [Ignavibacteriaceae bacterium]|nr:cysteine--tRNA ligase [Ignavibacteriaceae bacterium]
MLKIYNTLTKKEEVFEPLNPPEVKVYVCGPTVYDYFHIGNARTFITADMIRRYLMYSGYKVRFVMNVTDIDDKIIKKSIEEKVSSDTVAKKYSNAFFEDLCSLKILEADVYPFATENVKEIISMIKILIDKGYAYNIDGNVFFDISKFKKYGMLSGKKIDELESGARVEVDESKKNPLDFSLWKKAKEGEPYWESPWGKGRPGWHIECSAMSCKHLGETFDIHIGGNDLIFPHHENEIAQSEAANDKPFVKYWIHLGFLNINKEKMSKSLGNFFTARDVLQKYRAEAIRLFLAQAYYRGPIDFSNELLASSEKGLEKLDNLVDKIKSELEKNNNGGFEPEFDIQVFESKFKEVMDNDFNSAQAVAVIFDFVKESNRIIAENSNLNKSFYEKLKSFLDKIASGVFGICDFERKAEVVDGALEKKLVELLINIRTDAKKNKNYKLSDEIRNKLGEMGIMLQDSKEGTTYKKN